jgi:hypothetical protein
MVGEFYTTGIAIKQTESDNKWLAAIAFVDEVIAQGTGGTLSNNSPDDLLEVCRLVLEDAQKLGIKILAVNNKPRLYVKELVTNNKSTYEQISMAAELLDFEVCNCLPDGEVFNTLV